MMKDGIAASHFQLLEGKRMHSIFSLWCLKFDDKIFVIAALMSSYSTLTYLDTGLWGIPDTVSHPLEPVSYIVQNK